MSRRRLGSPAAAAVSLGGGRQRLTWKGSAPSGIAAAGRLYNAAADETKSARVLDVERITEETILSGESTDEIGERWMWEEIGSNLTRTEVVIDLEGGAAFLATETLYMGAVGRYEINAVLDTGRPLIDNLKILLSGCRGMLP